MSLLASPEAWLGLLTLTVLEIVLGIDNIIFISILAGKLPKQEQGRARRVGLAGAMLTRIALLAALAWIIRLTAPWFHLLGHPFSGRDVILIAGGLFLLAKSTREIHEGLEGDPGHAGETVRASFAGVVGQIVLLDIVFSLDSVITAVGMARHLPVMIGVSLIADGLGQHIAKGYIYFAMGFSVFVEMLNLRMRARTPPVRLREAYDGSFDTGGDEAY